MEKTQKRAIIDTNESMRTQKYGNMKQKYKRWGVGSSSEETDFEFQKMSSDEWRNDNCWGFHQIAQWLFRILAHIQPNNPEWKKKYIRRSNFRNLPQN